MAVIVPSRPSSSSRLASRHAADWCCPACRRGHRPAQSACCPPLPKPWRRAMRLPLAIISSKLPMSLVVTAWAPHSRRDAAGGVHRGVSTSIGTDGRSRATRRAVEPDPVNTIIAVIGTVVGDGHAGVAERIGGRRIGRASRGNARGRHRRGQLPPARRSGP